MEQLSLRLRSIDVFRALTMFFMIFVNDVDGVEKIPEWIKHVGEHTDGLGFADTIFPAFLFIVGLSLPFAIDKRIKEGMPRSSIFYHVALRSLALIVMGFLQVNLESYSNTSLLIKPVFEICITLGFFLIWLNYPKDISSGKKNILQAIGVIILIVMAFIFKGENHGKIVGLRHYWWGILGLIGWAYFICATIYIFTKGKFSLQIIALSAFTILNVVSHAYLRNVFSEMLDIFPTLGSASMPAFVMAGVVIAVLYKQLILEHKAKVFMIILFSAAAVMIVYGFIVRPFGGISKINDTPAWVGICSGIAMIIFGLMIIIVDINHKDKWARFLRPAGTSTLTCYLLPYLIYSLYELLHIHFPDFFNEGIGGILRSFITAFAVIFIAGLLEKKHLNLKI